ncbi:MAG: hypothetical protein BGP06_00140 [Rhizobiales bacterium 65-9]|nr:DUF2336 domain-containing protein [Hyphomicrobiales bacterium]OJY37198.1 MAG: hypothetical protein BGP06_00140 [Rhizobiales bacterium 65-9]
MSSIAPLLRDLDNAAGADEARRERMLERIADLYLGQQAGLNGGAVDVFDEVLVRLASEIARRARMELSKKLADADRGPPRLVRQLVHDEIEVARPLIERGTMLSEDDLLSIAMTRGDDHRQIVAGRPNISEKVTDALVERGGPPVLRRVAANGTAHISAGGFGRLVARADGDETLQRLLAERKDLSIDDIHRLIDVAGVAAKSRLQALLKNVSPSAVGAAVDGEIGHAHAIAGAATAQRSYDAAIKAVAPYLQDRTLGESHVRAFAEDKKFEEMACALSGLTRVSLKTIEAVFDSVDTDRFLVLCKALNFDWETVRAVARAGFEGRAGARPRTLTQMRDSYEKLGHKTAARIVQFLAEREQAASPAPA